MVNDRTKAGPDSFKIEASATSAALQVSGQAASRAVTALLDLISPFTNAAGWLGDKLAAARVNAAIRAASKAAEQLKEEGISQAQIPPKVLLPWLEGASLETDECDSLTDAWAGLFVRAAKSSDAVTISYIETLKKLGKEEAELLQLCATDTAPFFSQKFYREEDYEIFSDNNPFRKNALKIIAKYIKQNDENQLHEFMETWGAQGMCQIIFYSVPGVEMRQTEYFKKNEHVISNLKHLGLVWIKSKTMRTSSGEIKIIWFQITKYAFDFGHATAFPPGTQPISVKNWSRPTKLSGKQKAPMTVLEINNLQASADRPFLNGLDLVVNNGEVHAIRGLKRQHGMSIANRATNAAPRLWSENCKAEMGPPSGG